MGKKWKAALRVTILVLVSLILGVNLYLWNSQSLTGNALPMPFGYGAALVLTGSMEPTFSADDLIFVKEADSFEVGDIVVYQSGSMLVVHRVVEITEDALEAVAQQAMDRQIGARGLRAVMEKVMTGIMFRIPSDLSIRKVTINAQCLQGGEPILVCDEANPRAQIGC